MAVLADGNPFITFPFPNTSPAYGTNEGELDYDPDLPDPTQEKNGNALSHQGNGQNVVFNDGSVRFEDRVFCGINNDNIYAPWDMDIYDSDSDLARGLGAEPDDSMPSATDDWVPESRLDSFLVHETAEGAGDAPQW